MSRRQIDAQHPRPGGADTRIEFPTGSIFGVLACGYIVTVRPGATSAGRKVHLLCPGIAQPTILYSTAQGVGFPPVWRQISEQCPCNVSSRNQTEDHYVNAACANGIRKARVSTCLFRLQGIRGATPPLGRAPTSFLGVFRNTAMIFRPLTQSGQYSWAPEFQG